MKIYISGPITGQTNYLERFAKAEELLRQCGYEVVNPASTLAELPKGTSHEVYMEKSLELLSTCDGIYMLERWEKSTGASLEFDFANNNKLTIAFEQRSSL